MLLKQSGRSGGGGVLEPPSGGGGGGVLEPPSGGGGGGSRNKGPLLKSTSGKPIGFTTNQLLFNIDSGKNVQLMFAMNS